MEKLELKDRIIKRIPYIGGEPIPKVLVETIYRPEKNETAFAVYGGSDVRYEKEFPIGRNRALTPYSPENNLVQKGVILFPSSADEYGSQPELIEEVRAFIHRYVDFTPIFEHIAAHWVLLTWIFDAFATTMYLRLIGSFGRGKSRGLLTLGSLSFRPIFASSVSTVSPLFRILNATSGTLLLDEADFRVSDEKAELVRILNQGFARGFSILRSEQAGRSKEFNPVAYNVYGPKLLAARGYYADSALESRFITENMDRIQVRPDIPFHLPPSFDDEARQLRNKLLLFRFRNLKRKPLSEVTADKSIEPRLSQIFDPLLSLVTSQSLREQIMELMREYHQDILMDRGLNFEAQLLEVIARMPSTGSISVKEVTGRFRSLYETEYAGRISVKKIGFTLRKRLHLKTEKSHGNFVIPATEYPKLKRLFERYGIAEVELGDIGDIREDGGKTNQERSVN